MRIFMSLLSLVIVLACSSNAFADGAEVQGKKCVVAPILEEGLIYVGCLVTINGKATFHDPKSLTLLGCMTFCKQSVVTGHGLGGTDHGHTELPLF